MCIFPCICGVHGCIFVYACAKMYLNCVCPSLVNVATGCVGA